LTVSWGFPKNLDPAIYIANGDDGQKIKKRERPSDLSPESLSDIPKQACV